MYLLVWQLNKTSNLLSMSYSIYTSNLLKAYNLINVNAPYKKVFKNYY